MQATLAKYRHRIRNREVNPLVRWDGSSSRLIFDPADDRVPLTMMGFGGIRLDAAPQVFETRDREYAFVPVEGEFEVRIGPETYRGQREGGPFAGLPDVSNASAIYAPADARVEVRGRGEMVYFTAPARGHKPPAMVRQGERENTVRGSSIWLRRVITLFTPDDVSTVLVGGETYSPPGLWSGTPLHVHDREDPADGQSDHEEVYYHLARNTCGKWGPFSVQFLFDDQGLDEAYVIHDRDAFAIPGAAHPVVAGPNSDLLYIWALAGQSSELRMKDVPEFAYLKKIGAILDAAIAQRPRAPMPRAEFDELVRRHDLSADEAHVLTMHLRHQGINIA